MVIFLAIFLVLLVINIALLVFSTTNSKTMVDDLTKSISDQAPIKIYPPEITSSKYKKAI